MEYSYGKYLKLVEEGKIEEAVAYRAEHTPDYLYKFFGCPTIQRMMPRMKSVFTL